MRTRWSVGVVLLAACGIDAVGTQPPDGTVLGGADASVDGRVVEDGAVGPLDASVDAEVTCVADLATDPKNCGRCGHDCLGAACSAGTCATTAIVTRAGTAPHGVAVAGDLVYWTNFQGYSAQYNGVWYVSKTTPAATPTRIHTEDISNPNRIVTDGTNVFWTDWNNDPAYVLRCPVGAQCGSSWRLATSESYPDGVAFDATHAYWARNGSDQIVSCTISGCGSPTVVATNETKPSGVAARAAGGDTQLFWTLRGASGAIRTCTLSGTTTCTGQDFAAGQDDPVEIVVHGTDVYWTAAGSGDVRRCAAAGCGGAPVTVASAQTGLAGLAVDASGVYWVAGSNGTTGVVRTCPLAGCAGAPVEIAKDLNAPWGIALDATHVYVTTGGDSAVRRVAK